MVRKGSSYLKRRFSDIRNKILQSLDIYPKSTNEISTDVKCAYKTAKKHLLYLESIGVIKRAEFNIRRTDKNEEKDLWIRR